MPRLLRPLVARLLPDLKRVYNHHERAQVLVQPIVQRRQADCKIAAGYTKPNDTVQWIFDVLPESDKDDYAFQGVAQLAITAVSVQSTSKLLVNIILNLLKYDSYVPELKEEVRAVLASCGGEWTLDSMAQLEKLDSFMRESLRFEPPLTGRLELMPNMCHDSIN